MNKTLNINLGGYPFIINDDAYDLLSRYLGSIHRHFQTSGSYDEITSDIESRLAEIFHEKLGNRPIVEIRDVQAGIEIMGNPEDFGAEAIDNQSNTYNTQSEYRTGKRLFRDPEDKVFGGICSGIAAYFGINDPLWVRILFVLLVFVFGVSAIFYFILWIAIPEALSSADRLAMRGEPINVSNIAKVVEAELNNFSNAINNAGTTDSEKKNNAYSSTPNYNRSKAGQGLADGFSFIGETFRRIFDVIRMIFKPIFGFFGIIGLFVLGCFWISLVIAFAYGHPFAKALFGNATTMAYLAWFNVFFIVAAIITALILVFLNLFFKIRVKPKWYGFLGAFGLINGLSFGFMGAHLGREFSEEGRVKTEIFNALLPSDTLNIEIVKNRNEHFSINFDKIKINDGTISYDGIDFRVKKSSGNEFRVEKIARSQGNNIEEAEQLAGQIDYTPIFDGKTLTLNKFIDITGQKFRGQNVDIILYVPVGKYIRYGKNAHNWIAFDYDDSYDCEDDNDIQVWEMLPSGEMACPLAKKQNEAEKILSNTNFNTLKIKGAIDVLIKKGDKYTVKLEGKEKSFSKVEIIQNDNTLNVRSNLDDNDWEGRRSDVKLVVTIPRLDLIDVENNSIVTINGFSQKEMKINLFGEIKADIIVDVEALSMDVEKAKVDLQGKGTNLDARVDQNGELRARQYTVKTAKFVLNDGGEADIYASERVEQRGDSDNLDVTGGAEVDEAKRNDE